MRERFIVCQRPSCEAVKAVRSAYEQRTIRFCSKRCAMLVCSPFRTMDPADRLRGSKRSAAVRRAKTLARFAGMTQTALFRAAYSQGWKAGARSVRRRLQAATR